MEPSAEVVAVAALVGVRVESAEEMLGEPAISSSSIVAPLVWAKRYSLLRVMLVRFWLGIKLVYELT